MIREEKVAPKYVWYENPRYYLAAILLILGFRMLFQAFHSLAPSMHIFDGTILNGILFVILIFSLILLIRKGRQHGWTRF